ncbi:hypothetical protein EMIT0P395_70088 [Pseudomonas sp. IT-P395]
MYTKLQNIKPLSIRKPEAPYPVQAADAP